MMRSPASPVLRTPASFKSSRGGGPPGSNGALSHLTRPVTSYVPVAVATPAALYVVQLPPPVPAPEVPAPPPGATNVPSPVRVIFELSLARADACPPELTVNGGTKLTLTMSHRTCSA